MLGCEVSDGGPADTKYLSMGHLEWGVQRNDSFITQECSRGLKGRPGAQTPCEGSWGVRDGT